MDTSPMILKYIGINPLYDVPERSLQGSDVVAFEAVVVYSPIVIV